MKGGESSTGHQSATSGKNALGKSPAARSKHSKSGRDSEAHQTKYSSKKKAESIDKIDEADPKSSN